MSNDDNLNQNTNTSANNSDTAANEIKAEKSELEKLCAETNESKIKNETSAEKSAAENKGAFTKNVGSVGFATFLSRILGLLREQTFAAVFGAGTMTDAFNAAFRIPNMLRDLFAEGALSSAFIPTFTEYHKTKSTTETHNLANIVISALIVIITIITITGIFYSGEIVKYMAPGFENTAGKTEVTILMTKIMFPFLLLIAVASVFMGMLNSFGYFFVPAFAPALFNIGMITAGYTLCPLMGWFGGQPIVGMAAGVIIGGLMQMGVQWLQLKKIGYRFKFTFKFNHEGFLRIAALMLPATIGLGATQVNIFINTWLASTLAEGAISYLNYSFRLMQLPIGIFGVAIASVTLPMISAQIATGKREKIAETLESAITLVFLLTIPATFGLIFLREPIIGLLYEHGRFTAADTINTGYALIGYSVGLFGYSAVKILAPVFYAFKETKIPVTASIASVICNIILNFILIKKYTYFGLAIATSITMLLNFLVLFIFIKLRIGELSIKKITISFCKITLASAAMGIISFYIYDGILLNFKDSFFGIKTLFYLFSLGILIPFALLILFKFGKDLNVSEINTLSDVIKKRVLKINESLAGYIKKNK